MGMRLKAATYALCAGSLTAMTGQAWAGGLSNCYVRGDVGYGWSADDKGTASITPDTPTAPAGFFYANGYQTATGTVQGSTLDGSWFGEFGLGCAFVRQTMTGGSIKDAPVATSAPTGLRGDVTFGFHGSRDYSGIPINPPGLTATPIPVPAPPPTPPVTQPPVDPVHAKLSANTLMFNLYYDLPTFHRFTPYLGAGIGAAFLDLDNVTFTNGRVVSLGNRSDTNLAWSLMAGVATDVGRGIMLDVGYRYLDLGDISARPAGGYALKLHDVSEHQVKAGIRIPVGALSGR